MAWPTQPSALENVADYFPNSRRNFLRRRIAMDQPDARGFASGQLVIRGARLLVKLNRLLVDPRFLLARVGPVARMRAREARLGVDIDAQRQIGHQSAARDPVQIEHRLPT